jgi:5-amino-6-(5-phosphoribosylamino)uracil reductase
LDGDLRWATNGTDGTDGTDGTAGTRGARGTAGTRGARGMASAAGARDGLPYTVLSCSISMDGYIGTAAGGRLTLSNAQDLDRVDAVRAACDAILVGAATLRGDDPRLLVRDPDRRARRVAVGRAATTVKVTVTDRAALDPDAAFFTTGLAKLVYCSSAAAPKARAGLGSVATVVDAGSPIRMRSVSTDLHHRGIRTLLVEGGGAVHTQFLSDDLADELHLVMAPVFVGDSRARRFVDDGRFPWHPDRRATLADVQKIGDVVLLRYALSDRFRGDLFDPQSPMRNTAGVR